MTSRRVWFALAGAPWLWFVVRDLHPWLDFLAILWPVLGVAVVLVLAMLALRTGGLGWLAVASWMVVLGLVVVLPWRPLGGRAVSQATTVVFANVLGGADRIEALTTALGARNADILVVAEVAPELHRELKRLYGNGAFRYDVGVYSRFPVGRAGRAPGDQRGMRTVIDAPGGPIVLYAEHVQKPGFRTSIVESGFRTHRRTIDTIADAAAAERLPVILAGDLNLVERSSGYRRLTDVLDDAMRAGWTRPSTIRWITWPLLARIDHIMIDSSWCSVRSSVFAIPGSDHRGVEATVGPCA